MDKEKALKNQGSEFREVIWQAGGFLFRFFISQKSFLPDHRNMREYSSVFVLECI